MAVPKDKDRFGDGLQRFLHPGGQHPRIYRGVQFLGRHVDHADGGGTRQLKDTLAGQGAQKVQRLSFDVLVRPAQQRKLVGRTQKGGRLPGIVAQLPRITVAQDHPGLPLPQQPERLNRVRSTNIVTGDDQAVRATQPVQVRQHRLQRGETAVDV